MYGFAMKKLYGDLYESRYRQLQKVIPDNCSLLELCMGDLYFYENYLKKKNVHYSCADVNPIFVKVALAKNIHASLLDILKDEIPKSDYILIQAALSYSIPNHKELIEKLLKSANKQLIIAENINNVSNSGNVIVSAIGTFMSKAKAGQAKIKFTRESLKEAFKDFEANIVEWIEPADSSEVIIILQK